MHPTPILDPRAPAPDPLALLARPDKWQLGAGEGTIFAPPFPVWLDAPGFWDEATIHQYAFAPLYSVAFLDVDGREIALQTIARSWTPAALTVTYVAEGLQATETRTVQPGGVFVSEWRIRCAVPRTLHLIAFTAQDTRDVELGSLAWDGSLTFVRTLRDRRDVPFRVVAALTCLGGATSWASSLSERSAVQPRWRFTPFVEQWTRDGLPRQVRHDGLTPDGLLYAAVHRALAITTGEGTAAFAMRLGGADDGMRATPPRAAATPGSSFYAPPTLGAASRRRWREMLGHAPGFRCSDPYLENYWWYRWYGLWLTAVAPGQGHHKWPSMCEGVGFFHQPISYSAQCHARELRWLDDPERARGVLRTFFHHQKPDGSLHGRIYANHLDGTDFYHANWGSALLALDATWPDDAFVAELLPMLSRYANWLVRTRDHDASGMFDVIDQYETGQEYMSRYQAVDANADAYAWENRLRLKGIDVTVYAYELFRALEHLCGRLGDDAACTRWRSFADRTRTAVRTHMWDPDGGMFSDVNPATGERTNVRAAVCFYPYFTDLVDDEHVDGMIASLLDPQQFWTPFPAPSSSLQDPLFSATAEWKGKRHVCPWNGRVWPMTNSHLVEALALQSERRPELRAYTAHFVHRFIRMMCFDADPRRPNSFEHYNPFTAAPSVYRGIDDYQHSWVNDLIVQYVMGVRPHDGGIRIDPFPFGIEVAEMTNIRVRGRRIDVRIVGDRYTVTCDGETDSERLGTALEIVD